MLFRLSSRLTRFVRVAVVLLAATPVYAAQVYDDFSYPLLVDGDVMFEGNSQYYTKFIGASSQQALFLYEETDGNPDGAGSLNVAVAEKNYLARNTNGVDALDTLTISSDFQVAITGAPLTSGQDGTDDSLIGLQLATTPTWWNGQPWFDFTFVRRSDSTWGVVLDGTTMGSVDNSEIGLGDGTAASTSGWFTMSMTLTDNGATYDAVASVLYEGTEVWSSAAPVPTPYTSGMTLYGGYTTGDNADTGLEIADVSPISVGDLGKISSALVDNFSIVSVPEPSGLLALSIVLVAVGARGSVRGNRG